MEARDGFGLGLVCRRAPMVLILLAVILTSCNVTKHLDQAKGERLLTKNNLVIADKNNTGFSFLGIHLKKKKVSKDGDQLNFSDRTALVYELAPYYKQFPNKSIISVPFIPLIKVYPSLWWWYHSRGVKNPFQKWVMKKVAEPPSIYSQTLTTRTALNFENQMRQRGYFHAKCTYQVREVGKYYAYVTYSLLLGKLQTIDTVRFQSRDLEVNKVLQRMAPESRLKQGDALDGRTFDSEKLRITIALKDRGYAFFAPNFIRFSGDTSGTRTNVTVEVLPLNDTLNHKTYIIGDIQVFGSVVPDLSSIRADTTINGIYFASSEPKFRIRPKRLYEAIALRPSWPYRQVDFDKTARNLNALGVFRFVSVKPQLDSVNTQKINVAISFTPAKRFSLGYDFDVHSVTSNSGISNNLLGLGALGYLKHRNLFHGAEQLQSNLQYAVEFNVATHQHFIFSQEFKFQNELLLPRFSDYFGFWSLLHGFQVGKWRIVSDDFYDRLKQEGQTRMTANYNFLDVTSFYVYNLFNASYGYQLRSNPEHQYSFDHIGIDVLRPKFATRFDTNASEFLRRSFGNQLFTGFLLRSFSYTYLSKPNRFGEHWQFRLNTELSGLEILGLNDLWSAVFKKQHWTISDLEFSKYARLDMDLVYTREFRKDLVGALRIGTGVVTPFADTRDAPYVKQFFIGGPSGLRAWRIRELGPGAYHNPNPIKNQPYYESGDYRFEFNGELRFPFFWWFKGAVFVDGGNVWTLKPDATRPGSELNINSYKNVALGTGLGLRADFGYFVLRFDVGLKLRRPYQLHEGGSYWVINPFAFHSENLNLNLAVGYPF
jgi:outer membrane translocation and assembly module TamA